MDIKRKRLVVMNGASSGLAEQFLGVPRQSGKISVVNVELGEVVLFEIIGNFLDVFRIDKAHAKGDKAEGELKDTHNADDNW